MHISGGFELSFPFRSDFDATDEETLEMVKEDFIGFIREGESVPQLRKLLRR